ncbi:MAG: UDP-N-acetylmuramate dehydrogenase, partial [Candidatus Omnitrophota bacterium]|nr:UDP-N-acetylmuramate dehydrogenase [Candidatus Omnitrophota bacterium]
LKMKKDKQVLDMPSAGCVFKNPKDFQFTAGQMIDMLGLKGKRSGGAQVSEKHANFIINRKSANCGDVLKLIDIIKKRVMDNYNVSLELEIKLV